MSIVRRGIGVAIGVALCASAFAHDAPFSHAHMDAGMSPELVLGGALVALIGALGLRTLLRRSESSVDESVSSDQR